MGPFIKRNKKATKEESFFNILNSPWGQKLNVCTLPFLLLCQAGPHPQKLAETGKEQKVAQLPPQPEQENS